MTSDINASRITRRQAMIGLAGLAATPAAAQTDAWPARPLRIIVGFPPGQSIDIVARIVAEPLGKQLGQSVVVENRPGAGGRLGFDLLKRSAPDGYTLGFGSNGPLTVAPTLYADLPYNVERDLQAVATCARAPYVLLVRPDSPIRDAAALRSQAQARPGMVTYGTPGIGTMQHLTTQMFATTLGISLLHVPYRGGPEVLTDLIGGRLDLAVDSLPGAMSAIRGNQVRVVAITSATRNDLLPDVPTLPDLGLPEVQSNGWYGLLAPAGLPPRVAARLYEAISQAIAAPETVALLSRNALTPYVIPGTEFATLMREDTARFRDVIRTSNIRID